MTKSSSISRDQSETNKFSGAHELQTLYIRLLLMTGVDVSLEAVLYLSH